MKKVINIKNDNRRRIDRIGMSIVNKYGSVITIVEYKNYNTIKVKFDNGFEKYASFKEFNSKNIKSPYCRTLYGVGYLGEGEYKTYGIDKKHSDEYKCWSSMMERCYSKKKKLKNPTYEESIVCEEWHNFQNFAKWYEENYYALGDSEMGLDKDILHKNNKTYSPENCVFVPHFINKIFTKTDSKRGKYPIGVYFKKKNNKFVAQCHTIEYGKQKHLGLFKNPTDAFYAYKEFKEKYIKNVADEYRGNLPEQLYLAMYNYKVEISD